VNAQRGSMSAFVVCMATGCLALAAFVHDSGRVMARYVSLADAAQNAARIGAQSLRGIRAGDPNVDHESAVRRAQEHLAGLGLEGAVDSDAASVTVTIVDSVPPQLLSMFGVGSKTIIVRRSAVVQGG